MHSREIALRLFRWSRIPRRVGKFAERAKRHKWVARDFLHVIQVRFAKIECDAAILEHTSHADVDRPDAGKYCVIQSHCWCKPDESEEAQVHWVSEESVSTARNEVAPRHLPVLIPVHPLSPAGLETQPCQMDAVEHAGPGKQKTAHNESGCYSVQIPQHQGG